MILIDPRIGSKELIPYFSPYDVPVREESLQFGDLAHFGNGPDGTICIGYERKVLPDMIQSMRSDRYSGHQLPGLMESYQVVHLIIEGVWRVGKSGAIEVPRRDGWQNLNVGPRAVLFRELDGFLATLQYKRGVVVVATGGRSQTAEFVVSRFKWWDKDWGQHRSDEAIYAPFSPVVGGSGGRASFTRRTVQVVEKMLAQIEGIDAAAYSIAKYLEIRRKHVDNSGTSSMEVLMELSALELSEIPVEQHGKKGARTIRLGPAKAKRIWEQLRGI